MIRKGCPEIGQPFFIFWAIGKIGESFRMAKKNSNPN